MRRFNFVILVILILSLLSISTSAQDDLDLDYSITMPSIEVIQGSIAVPAPLDLLTQGILKIFADTNRDDNITQEEADALFEGLSDETKANLSLRLEDLEPLIQMSIGIDFQEALRVEVLDMKLLGLVGPVNSSTPLAFVISFNAEFNVEDRIGHTISFAINDSYAGDVAFEFTAPSGWEVDKVSGLSGQSIEGLNVYGTPVAQININISEEIGTEFIVVCVGIGIMVVVAIVLIVFFILKQKKSESSQIPAQQYPQNQTTAPAQPDQAPPPPRPDQYQTAPQPQPYPMQIPVQAPAPPPQSAPNICRQCGSNMALVQQNQRYYCNTCRQYR